jgi:DTW domain-containing protein
MVDVRDNRDISDARICFHDKNRYLIMETEENQSASRPSTRPPTKTPKHSDGLTPGDSSSGTLRVLIVQHPREAKRPHGTAQLVTNAYPNARICKGLAWPNLKKAWLAAGKSAAIGEPGKTGKSGQSGPGASADVQIGSRWGVLYLSGRGEAAKLANQEPGVFEFGKGKSVRPLETPLDGVVLIDGNWKEAKTLWWRNAWFLRLTRLVLVEEPASAIRQRRSAQKAALSTAECVAYCLKYLARDDSAAEQILTSFRNQVTSVDPAPFPKP